MRLQTSLCARKYSRYNFVRMAFLKNGKKINQKIFNVVKILNLHPEVLFFPLKAKDSYLRGTKFSNRGWKHRQSRYFAKCFSFRKHFNNEERRKLLESVCAYVFNLDLKHIITNRSWKRFFQHDNYEGWNIHRVISKQQNLHVLM